MAPVSKEKSKERKDNADRQKRILASKEKILKVKQNILSIVEAMLEKEISKEWFLRNCTKLCHADYDDVVQERSIEHLCGYPLCSNTIPQTTKQKYHISRSLNKVYDLTERKMFCSNPCYKASQYLKAQLSPIPLYMRKEEHIEIHLLSGCNNRGSAGEEIVFHHTLPKEEIEKVFTMEHPSDNYINILNDEIKNCSDSLSQLKINEHVIEKQFVFDNQTAQQKENILDQEKESSESSDIDNDDSEDEKLFPDYDEFSSLSHKQMPVPKKSIKSLLISPLEASTISSPKQLLSLDFVFDVLKDWMTEDSMKYLLGEKYVYSIKADHLFEKMRTADPVLPDKLASIKSEYINLCLKIDNLPDDDLNDSDEIDFLADITETKCGGKSFKKRLNNSNGKGKKVTFASISNNATTCSTSSDYSNISKTTKHTSGTVTSAEGNSNLSVNTSVEEENEAFIATSAKDNPISASDASNRKKATDVSIKQKQSLNVKETRDCSDDATDEGIKPVSAPYEGGIPLVDSVSQNALRRQILSRQLKSVYSVLLPVIGLHYRDVIRSLKMFIGTLSLTPTNIMFKPKEWKLIALILLRILTRTVLKDIYEEEQFIKLCEDPVIPTKVNVADIEKLVHDILSPENVLSLPMVLH